MSIHSVLFLNLHSLATPSSRRSIRHQLRMATLLETHKPKHSFLNRLAHRQQSMILQQRRFLVTQCLCNIFAFLFDEHDALETVVEHVVVVESTAVLRDGIERAT
jgi:hypothetical protein